MITRFLVSRSKLLRVKWETKESCCCGLIKLEIPPKLMDKHYDTAISIDLLSEHLRGPERLRGRVNVPGGTHPLADIIIIIIIIIIETHHSRCRYIDSI